MLCDLKKQRESKYAFPLFLYGHVSNYSVKSLTLALTFEPSLTDAPDFS